MSATGRSEAAGTGVVRHPDDYYATPAWCTRAILPHLGDLSGKSILEPSCGDGSIIRALPPEGFVVGVEMDRDRAAAAEAVGRGLVHCADFFAFARMYENRAYDIAIGNPPFKLAMEFVQETRRIARTVAFLLRLPWLASQGRASWLRANTPSVYVLPKRPSFTGKGTDATDYAWLVWSEQAPTVCILDTAA